MPESTAQNYARRAFYFAAHHPKHPLAEILRHKAMGLSYLHEPSSLLEIKLLLDKAQAWLDEQTQGKPT